MTNQPDYIAAVKVWFTAEEWERVRVAGPSWCSETTWQRILDRMEALEGLLRDPWAYAPARPPYYCHWCLEGEPSHDPDCEWKKVMADD